MTDQPTPAAPTPDTPAPARAPDAGMREQYAAAIDYALLPTTPDRQRRQVVAEQAAVAVLAVRDRRLEEAEAAGARVRRLCEMTIADSVRVQAVQQARDTLAALDQQQEADR